MPSAFPESLRMPSFRIRCRHFSLAAASSSARRKIQRPTSVDRKSTRLNSSHSQISYAVFCLKKKNKHQSGERRTQSDRPRVYQIDVALEDATRSRTETLAQTRYVTA